MSSQARYVEEVRRIVTEALRSQPVEVFFFGSRAWGTEHRYSDVDVAILRKGPLSAWKWLELEERLEQSWVPYEVDLVDLDEAPAELREKVLERGIRWIG